MNCNDYTPKTMLLCLVATCVFAIAGIGRVDGQTCEALIGSTNKCACEYVDGATIKTIDFTPLSKNDGKPAFPYKRDPGDEYDYAYNPCHPFSDAYCTNVAACQVSADKQNHYPIGDANSAKIELDTATKDIIITYTSGTRKSDVRFHCDPTATKEATYTVLGEEQPVGSGSYAFTIGTCLACVDDVPNCYVSSSNSLTPGGVMCIIFTVLVVVYIVGGVLIQKFVRGATGKEVFPNYSFWSDFPALVKDGVMFLIGLCKGEDTTSGYESIK